MIKSLLDSASLSWLSILTPSTHSFFGSIVFGPKKVSSQLNSLASHMWLFATLLWIISPIMQTFRFSSVFFTSYIVTASNRACEGCSFIPSPAFIMGMLVNSVKNLGYPDS